MQRRFNKTCRHTCYTAMIISVMAISINYYHNASVYCVCYNVYMLACIIYHVLWSAWVTVVCYIRVFSTALLSF